MRFNNLLEENYFVDHPWYYYHSYDFLLILFGFPRSSHFPRRQQSQLHVWWFACRPLLLLFSPLPALFHSFLVSSPHPPGCFLQGKEGAVRILHSEGSGTPLLGQRPSWVLASSGTLLGKQRWRTGPGYLILATLYWDLEICLCCQEIYNCNCPNISRKQTKSCWFCLYCYLFTDWKCQEWSLTVRNSMPVLQMFGSGIILCI